MSLNLLKSSELREKMTPQGYNYTAHTNSRNTLTHTHTAHTHTHTHTATDTHTYFKGTHRVIIKPENPFENNILPLPSTDSVIKSSIIEIRYDNNATHNHQHPKI